MIKKFIIKIRNSIWLNPVIFSLISLALAVYVVLLDKRTVGNIHDIIPEYLLADFDSANRMLSTISTALITMLTFTFSTMMIVLTMYSSQFSPRSLPNFLKDRKSTVVMGIFMGSFIYSLTSLFFLRQNKDTEGVISATVGLMLVIVCLAFFTFFIYHVTTSIQVEDLINKLHKDAIKIINDQMIKFERGTYAYIPNVGDEMGDYSIEVFALKNGYVQMIDYKGLTKDASKNKGIIKTIVKIGKFVVNGEKLAVMYSSEPILLKDMAKKIRDRFTIENQRNTSQDIEYSIEKLVDIALRAISPGINDPNTARESINAIGLVLAEAGSYYSDKTISVKDEEGNNRVILEEPDFKEILYQTFYQLRHYGNADISIKLSNIDALITAAHKSSRENKSLIWSFHRYIVDLDLQTEIKEMDKNHLESKINELKNLCNDKFLD